MPWRRRRSGWSKGVWPKGRRHGKTRTGHRTGTSCKERWGGYGKQPWKISVDCQIILSEFCHDVLTDLNDLHVVGSGGEEQWARGSLRCGGRQGSALGKPRFDKRGARAAPLTTVLATAGRYIRGASAPRLKTADTILFKWVFCPG